MAWMVFGRQWYESSGRIKYPTKPFYTHGCQNVTNSTLENMKSVPLVKVEYIKNRELMPNLQDYSSRRYIHTVQNIFLLVLYHWSNYNGFG